MLTRPMIGGGARLVKRPRVSRAAGRRRAGQRGGLRVLERLRRDPAVGTGGDDVAVAESAAPAGAFGDRPPHGGSRPIVSAVLLGPALTGV